MGSLFVQIMWKNRRCGSTEGQQCSVSLGGIDFRINEPRKHNEQWFSGKLRGPGMRYEIGLNINNGHIVWAFGGYPCKEFSDLQLAREAFVPALDANEQAMADKSYRKDPSFITPTDENKKEHKEIMSRHEAVAKRLRLFQILKVSYRHELEKHNMVFHAIVNLTQLMIEHEEPIVT